MTIEGVPKSVTRGQVVAMLQSLGIDAKSVRSLTLHVHSIEAEVFATGTDGRWIVEDNDLVVHQIHIPIGVDPAPAAPGSQG